MKINPKSYLVGLIVKFVAVASVSFGVGWMFYKWTHDDPMLKEDYTEEEVKLQEIETLKGKETEQTDAEAEKDGYKRFNGNTNSTK